MISMGSCYVMGTNLVSVFISDVAGNESWFMGIGGAIVFMPVLWVYLALAKRYSGRSLFEINELALGSTCGRMFSLLYLSFFLTLGALNVIEAANFLYYFIMPDTPLIFIAIFLVAACVYCVKRGLLAIARVSTIFLIIAVLGMIFTTILSISHMNLDFLFPVFNRGLIDYVQSAHIAAAIPFGESFIFLMIVPELSEKASVRKVYVGMSLFTVFIMTLVYFREVLSLGPIIDIATLPSFEAVRIINIDDIFSRIESLFALLLVSLTFFKILIIFSICLKGTKQLFRLESYEHLIIMLGAFFTVYAIGVYGSPSRNIFWGKNVSPFIWSFFSFLMPLITLFVSGIRGKKHLAGGRLGK